MNTLNQGIISFILTIVTIMVVGVFIVVPNGGDPRFGMMYIAFRFPLTTLITITSGTIFGGLSKDFFYAVAIGTGLIMSVGAFLLRNIVAF